MSYCHAGRAFLVAQLVKKSACNAGDPGSSPGLGSFSGKEMATHSAILAWEIPWREKPCGLQSMESQKSRRNFVTKQQESYLYLVNS